MFIIVLQDLVDRIIVFMDVNSRFYRVAQKNQNPWKLY